MATGIGAAIFYVLMGLLSDGGTNSVMYGASGAVYGVMTAFGIIFSEMELRIFFFIPIKAKYLVLILGTMAIINSFGPMSGGGDGIAHLAHLGGIVVAIILLLYWRSKGRY
jgi:membrane associated rhomboid family serine protease